MCPAVLAALVMTESGWQGRYPQSLRRAPDKNLRKNSLSSQNFIFASLPYCVPCSPGQGRFRQLTQTRPSHDTDKTSLQWQAWPYNVATKLACEAAFQKQIAQYSLTTYCADAGLQPGRVDLAIRRTRRAGVTRTCSSSFRRHDRSCRQHDRTPQPPC